MTDAFVSGLRRGDVQRTVDITTTGAKSGQPRRIEIWIYEFEGRLFLAGSPGRRDWYANLLADPRLTVHITQDEPAEATGRAERLDAAERERVIIGITDALNEREHPLMPRVDQAAWLAGSPILEVVFDEV